MTKRRNLFSVHTTDYGKVCIYLEEQDACLDLVENMLGFATVGQLDELQAANSARPQEGDLNWAINIDNARAEIPEMALLIASMTEDEAFDLCQDIVTSIKKRRIFDADSMSDKVAKLRVVE